MKSRDGDAMVENDHDREISIPLIDARRVTAALLPTLLAEPDGRVLLANSALLQLLGLPTGSMPDLTIHQFIVSEHQTRAKDWLERICIPGAHPHECYMEMVFGDGSPVQAKWSLAAAGSPQRRLCLLTIHGEACSPQIAPDDCLAMLTQALDGIPDPAVWFWKTSKTIIGVNRAWRRATGFNSAETPGSRNDQPGLADRSIEDGWVELPASPEEDQWPLKVCVRGAGEEKAREFTLPAKSVQDCGQDIALAIFGKGDGTEVWEASQRQDVRQLEALSLLTADVAHDFKNMLAIIMARSQLAQISLPPDGPEHAALNEINKTAQQAGHLADRLLALCRKSMEDSGRLNLKTGNMDS